MKAIYLYTMNGITEAQAIGPFKIQGRMGEYMQISAIIGGVSIIVNHGLYESKMQDDKPTFFAC